MAGRTFCRFVDELLARHGDHVLGFGDLAVHDLQPETDFGRLVIGLDHEHATDLLRHRVRAPRS